LTREMVRDAGIASLDKASWERLLGCVDLDRDRIALILLREAGLDLESLLKLEVSDLHLDGDSLRLGSERIELQKASALPPRRQVRPSIESQMEKVCPGPADCPLWREEGVRSMSDGERVGGGMLE